MSIKEKIAHRIWSLKKGLILRPLLEPSNLLEKYSSFIKDIYLDLGDYKFFHSPSSKDRRDKRLIGRDFIKNRIKTILKNSDSKAGAYLVTGFRGMGKTSAVREALREIDGKPELNEPSSWPSVIKWAFRKKHQSIIEISFAQDDIKDIDVLRLICKKTYQEYKRYLQPINTFPSVRRISKYVILFLLYILIWNSEQEIEKFYSELIGDFRLNYLINSLSRYQRFFLAHFHHVVALYGACFLLQKIAETLGIITHSSILRKLENLDKRIQAEVSLEHSRGINGTPNINHLGTKFGGFFSRKDTLSYPIAGSKEIESELVVILEMIDHVYQLFGITFALAPEFIFIFDELDKISPNYNASISEKEKEDPEFIYGEEATPPQENMRQRQEVIARILSNLKHFLNVARAKFIFIAGREMFDAALADVSDRDAFFTTIFHDTLYVSSFLKENLHNRNPGVTRMTEVYVCQFLIDKQFLKKQASSTVP
ncbi:MAG: ATP-binding protein, partial [Bacteroidota bacterium]